MQSKAGRDAGHEAGNVSRTEIEAENEKEKQKMKPIKATWIAGFLVLCVCLTAGSGLIYDSCPSDQEFACFACNFISSTFRSFRFMI